MIGQPANLLWVPSLIGRCCSAREKKGVKESETALLKGRSQVGEEALNREHLSARQKITTCTSRCSSYSSCSSCTLTTYQQAPHNRERRFNKMVTIRDGPPMPSERNFGPNSQLGHGPLACPGTARWIQSPERLQPGQLRPQSTLVPPGQPPASSNPRPFLRV
jgi:hypothetical protein